MPDYDAIVVGGGLFGSTVARALMAQGRRVVVLDDANPNAGWRPSACLMKPSWFSGLGKAVHEPALATLSVLYGLDEIEFHVGIKGLKQKVLRVNPDKLRGGFTPAVLWEKRQVEKVEPGRVYYTMYKPSETHVSSLEAPLIVVAAGIWTGHLLPQIKQVGKWGAAFRAPIAPFDGNKINVWAPIKQTVVFEESQGSTWAGDGTALLEGGLSEQRLLESRGRCEKAAGHTLGAPIVGVRPYAKGAKPCLLQEIAPGLWAATGGAKNGMLAAGWAAQEIARRSEWVS